MKTRIHARHRLITGWMLTRRRVAGVLALLLAAFIPPTLMLTAHADTPPLTVRVVGNHLVNAQGATLQLRGVNRSGTQYACMEGWGIFDGPSDQASVDAMASWKMNAVRVNGNEDCALGINGVPTAYAGANYINALKAYIAKLHAAGIYVILDLHHNAPGTH